MIETAINNSLLQFENICKTQSNLFCARQ